MSSFFCPACGNEVLLQAKGREEFCETCGEEVRRADEPIILDCCSSDDECTCS